MKIKKENIMNRFLKMNRFFKSCLIGSAGLILLAVTLSFTAPGRAVAQAAEDCIRICNTASNPIHVIVQGITRISGEVKINNENAIATTVTGPVQVSTSPREPLYVIQRKKVDDIFQEQISLKLKLGDLIETQEFHVPAGKLLSLKYASGTANIKGNPSDFSVRIRVIDNNFVTFNSPLIEIFQGGFEYQIGGNPIGISVPPGGTVQVRFERSSFLIHEANLELALSGDYDDL